MKKQALIFTLCATLAGCSGLPSSLLPEAWRTQAPPPSPSVSEPVEAEIERPEVAPEKNLETVALPEKIEPVVQTGVLGRTIASLGSPAEQGLWLKTPLVTSEGAGQVTFLKSGKQIDVTLIPIDGPSTAGSRMSLQAFQALGAPLTDLIEISVKR